VSTNRYCAQVSPGVACPIRPTVSVIPLASDKVHASGARTPLFTGDSSTWEQQTQEPKVEGPWAEKRGSTYFVFYSGGDYRAAYGMGYATASSPTGTFSKSPSNPILKEANGVLSPGGGSMIKGPRGGDWLIYHGRVGDYTQPRTLRIDPVTFGTGTAAVAGPTSSRQSPAP
jgi:hypothetical protein